MKEKCQCPTSCAKNPAIFLPCLYLFHSENMLGPLIQTFANAVKINDSVLNTYYVPHCVLVFFHTYSVMIKVIFVLAACILTKKL